jgi:hypothetical protein
VILLVDSRVQVTNLGKTTIPAAPGVTITGGLTVMTPGLTVTAGDVVAVGDVNIGVGAVSVTSTIAGPSLLDVAATSSSGAFTGNAVLGRLTGTGGNALLLSNSAIGNLFRVWHRCSS